jgi:mRNA interferase MazF
MTEGDVALTPLPQADGQIKNRPAIVLRKMPPFGDLLVCGVSTQIHLAVNNFDELIQASDSDFAGSGLKSTSLIRLGYLAVLPKSSFLGRIGAISSGRHNGLLERLAQYLTQ